MPTFAETLAQGAHAGWLFVPTAVLLGALHGLEPGHSKTMMAAFIIAVRGTIPQAVLLGLSAMVSHTAVIWVLGLAAITWGDELIGERAEPVILFASGVVIIALGLWMVFRMHRVERPKAAHAHHHHDHPHNHDHHREHGHADAHAALHARRIAGRFTNRRVTTGQVILFGLAGGLLPCSAAIAVLLVCLQVHQYALGIAVVGAFSLGLGLTLVAVGVLAAWGVRHAARHLGRFDGVLQRLPYLSGAVVILIGVTMAVSGYAHLGHGHVHA